MPPLKTAMEVLIEAMQSDELDIKDKARIADKLAPFESSRAPIISIEHVQNSLRDEEEDADGAMENFLESLRKV
jgi:two-component sensor histidine kinase